MTHFILPAAARRLGTAVLLGTAAALTLPACAPLVVGGAVAGSALVATDRRTSGAQLEDQGIELRGANRVREQLGERGSININSYNRQVLLTGEVPTEQDKAQVEKIVAGVDNVVSVVNELAVQGSSSFSQRSSDTLLTGQVKAVLVDARDLHSNAFKVTTRRGTVYLMGRVTQREADRATEIIRNISGVQRVVRLLEIISEAELARMLPQPAPEQKADPAAK
jgi:osmotically-inducible protein OsmY